MVAVRLVNLAVVDKSVIRARPLYFIGARWIEVNADEWDSLRERVLQLGGCCQRLESENKELWERGSAMRSELLLRESESNSNCTA